MTEPKKQYVLPTLEELTLNDAFVIKAATRVDILRPPTVAHSDAALLWFVTKDTDAPLKYEDLTRLTFEQLADLIADPVDDDEDLTVTENVAAAEAAIDLPDGADDQGKASEPSPVTSSTSPALGVAPPHPFGSAQSPNFG